MRQSPLTILSGLILATTLFSHSARCEPRPVQYPFTKSEDTQDILFETKVKDPYRWLENNDSAAVMSWTESQNKIAESYLAGLPDREKLRKRFEMLYSVDSLTVPVKRKGLLFYEHRLKTKEQPILCWRHEDETAEHVLIDLNKGNPGNNTILGQWIPSPDGEMVAYALHQNNVDKGLLHIIDVKTGKEKLDKPILWAAYADFTWSRDGRGFYYTRLPSSPDLKDPEIVSHTDVAFHSFNQNGVDRSVYPPTGNSSLYLTPLLSKDAEWLFITITDGWSSNEIRYRSARDDKAPFQLLFTSTSSLASVAEWKGNFYLLTNDSAPHYKILKAQAARRGNLDWKCIVPERADATITTMKIIGNRLVLLLTKNASSRLETYSLDGQERKEVPFSTMGSISEIQGEENDDSAYFGFESFVQPLEIRRLAISKNGSGVWAKTKPPIHPDHFTITQVWYRSKDNTPVSMFLLRNKKKGFKSLPFLLEGYGGFNVSLQPWFEEEFVVLLENGIGVAIPNLRGGGEYGEDWHKDGMRTKKQNTIDDFLSASEYLIKEGFTRSDLLAIQGSSNGGLLVAAALTLRPDLFQVAVCGVPIADMVRYPLFGEGPTWISEYGSPTSRDEFRALFSYSPYHHVVPGTHYPSVLIISSDHDDRVDPMHARKMTAALQTATAASNPILLLTLRNAGHSGAGLKKNQVDEMVDKTSFLLHALRH